MRIGIYTQPLRLNYGGILQNWALQTVLKRMGHQVVTLDPCPYLTLSWKQKPIRYAKRIVRKLLGKPTILFYEDKKNREYDIQSQHLRHFISANINRLEFNSVNELQATSYDALIAGSDQVWRPKYNKTYGRTIENAFLDFAADWNVKRIAYSASLGTDEWEFTDTQTARCSRLAKKFDAISVREQSSVALCKQYLGVDSVHVLDPTMLLEKEDYIHLVQNSQTEESKGSQLCYMLDDSDERRMLIDRIAKERRLVPFYGNNPKMNENTLPPTERIQPPLEQWLRGFMDAEFVVTDSFHACVFSIIFGKPFVVVGNYKRGMSRFTSLLDVFSLQSHLLSSINDYNPKGDYTIGKEVLYILEKKRKESLGFLEASLFNRVS